MNKVKNLWCGFFLSPKEKKLVTEMALKEFKKPFHERMRPYQLVETIRQH